MVIDIHVQVVEQGETIERVELNVDKTKKNVEVANKELHVANIISRDTFKTKWKKYKNYKIC